MLKLTLAGVLGFEDVLSGLNWVYELLGHIFQLFLQCSFCIVKYFYFYFFLKKNSVVNPFGLYLQKNRDIKLLKID